MPEQKDGKGFLIPLIEISCDWRRKKLRMCCCETLLVLRSFIFAAGPRSKKVFPTLSLEKA